MRKIHARVTVLLLALLVLSCAACGGNGTEAAVIRLIKTQGSVGVSDDRDKEIEVMENLGLYDGYRVGTREESYAWINLDSVKLTKMDEDSEIGITKLGRKLEIDVLSGSLFFHITEPLAEEETLEIRTSTMGVGIRGTCGWVTDNMVCLLEGNVTVTAGEQTVTVSAGEMAVATPGGTLEVKKLSMEDIPAFVREEVEDDAELTAAVSGRVTPGDSEAAVGELDPDGSAGETGSDAAAGETGSDAAAGSGVVPWAEAGLADHVMDWGDEALAAGMAQLTGITDRDIMLSDVWELTSLRLVNYQISDISALAELGNLTDLTLGRNQISDISALNGLTNLVDLRLESNQISDISAIGSLTNLTILTLGSNQISDISALADLTNLEFLDLGSNQIRDVSALADLADLTNLNLEWNQISDVSALGGLTKLEKLRLGGNQISDYSPVEFVSGLVK